MCTAVITTWLANESKMGVLYLAKQSSLLVASFPMHESYFKYLGRHPGRQGGS